MQSEAERRLLWATAAERLWWGWLQSTAGSLFIHHTISSPFSNSPGERKKKNLSYNVTHAELQQLRGTCPFIINEVLFAMIQLQSPLSPGGCPGLSASSIPAAGTARGRERGLETRNA